MKWKKVPGYLVEVTKYGDVRDLFTGAIKNQYVTNKGYLTTNVKTNNDERKVRRIHQLVALAWIGPCPPDHEVNHKDLNKKNNYYKNLEWVTSKENHLHAIRHGIRYGKLHKKQVLKIIKLRKKGLLLKEIAKRFDIDIAHVSVIVNKKSWKHLYV
jgi:hypothetical protein